MKKIVIDVENTTTQLTDKYSDYSPYNPNNKLVSVGWCTIENDIISPVKYLFLRHKELKEVDMALFEELRQTIADSSLLIAHNAKFDISWLRAAGFDLSHLHINDTMIMEYVMARGRNDISFSLRETCPRYGVAEKGEDIFEKYPDLMISEMPMSEVQEYGMADIQACAELYLAQVKRLNRSDYVGLHKTVHMMHEFCSVIQSIEANGVKIDDVALDQVEQQFSREANELKHELNVLVHKVMGDTPINLDSPQQLSEVIYSRKIIDGKEKEWLSTFNIGKDHRGKNLRRPKMNYQEFAMNVQGLTQKVLKTTAAPCETCRGIGKVHLVKKDGNLRNKPNKCKVCSGIGVIYTEINEIAGFKMKPTNINFTTVSGFSTSKTFLEELIDQAKDKKKDDAVQFLTKLMRLSALSSYLSTFVGGIRNFTQKDSRILHPNFNQCITATGRLSSTNPNLQNQPREKTFPIRKVFVSRWEGGEVAEVDFSQLEFRCAVHLAKDYVGRQHILEGMDIHNQTKRIITEAGQPMDRQEAKKHTFKPLYGGKSGTEAEKTYYTKFLSEVYTGIGEWHKVLQETAIESKVVTIPTGRQFLFPDARRTWHGGCTNATQIVNYPVQSFATADVLPIALIRLFREFKKLGLNSLLVLTVHDSVAVDIFPGERAIVLEALSKLAKFAEEELKIRYGIEMFVPLDCEVKVGYNLMEMVKQAA